MGQMAGGVAHENKPSASHPSFGRVSLPETTRDRNEFSRTRNRWSDELSRTTRKVPEARRYLPRVADHCGAHTPSSGFESLRAHSTAAYINTTTAHDPIIAVQSTSNAP
ncbi:hypothetical protein KC19_1G091100 [Ceratodon purpureus]|uniref:Uncharacterized protein n=1 Tax=Ceratodon purpureus TaxID=3225 RepID=A0A8T0J471_CERPU|nr:hypothetical protein KC19_1G091100 [Ceratodon purpureus]